MSSDELDEKVAEDNVRTSSFSHADMSLAWESLDENEGNDCSGCR
jgi:hypothetical protein